MLDAEGRFVTRDMHGRGLPISEIARRTGHDRKAVREAFNGTLEPASKARRPKKRKIDPYVPYPPEARKCLDDLVHHGRYGVRFTEFEPGRTRANVVGGFRS